MKPTPPPRKPRCGKRYPDKLAAKLALARIQARSTAGRPKTERHAYFHTPCNGWHLTAARSAGNRSGKTRRTPLAAVPPPTPARRKKQTGFTAAVKLLIRTRAGGGDPRNACCEACGIWLGEHGGQIQHRLARQIGGSRHRNRASNGALLCGNPFTGCHGSCEFRNRRMHAEGFWLESWQDPAQAPIMLHGRHGGGPVWLDDDGSYTYAAPWAEAA